MIGLEKSQHDMLQIAGFILLLSSCLWTVGHGSMCDRTTAMAVPKTPGNGNFEVIIQGSPGKYVPGAVYPVRIQGKNDQQGTEKFSKFLLVAEPALGNAGQVSPGTFRLKDDSQARFSEFCPNAVKHASELPKSSVEVLWVAPPVSAGCVVFKATVVKNNQQWYMDDEDLTEPLCPEDEDEDAGPCTACDEAKYELTFEGVWSALTHPKHFPPNGWGANFSDIIGASHGPHFRFWDYGNLASEGLRQVAESGDSRALEGELKEQSENIRTIIKARGLRHTNFNGLKTFAVFRTDKNHNFISLVSKIDPSPDWFVGVSAVNLCGRNGSWLAEKVLQLYPNDAGTDSGSSYTDPDSPTIPRVEIQRLVWSSNPDSPFYDPDGNALKPFAILRLQQQRTYKRGACEETFHPTGSFGHTDYGDDEFDENSPHRDTDRPECAMYPWSQWSPCNPTCGTGTKKKTRRYVNEVRAREAQCNRQDTVERPCHNPRPCKGTYSGQSSYDDSGRQSPYDQLNVYNVDNRSPYYREPRPRQPVPGVPDTGRKPPEEPGFGDPLNDVCGTTEWRPWSICSDPCGKGVRHQTRSFLRPMQAKIHKCETHIKLKNTSRCPKTPECRDPEDVSSKEVGEGCDVTDWGPWRPCSVTCGKGIRTRDRLYKFPLFDHRQCKLEMQQTETCDGIQQHCPPERTTDNLSSMPARGRHSSHSRPIDDNAVMPYNQYSGHDPYRQGTSSYSGMSRLDTQPHTQTYPQPHTQTYPQHHAQTYPQHQTQTYPQHLTQTYPQHHTQTYPQRYQYPTPPPTVNTYVNPRPYQPPYIDDGPRVDCKLSAWSPWSSCSVSCGWGWEYKSRYIEVFNENGGHPCSPKLERSRRCRGTNCPRNSPHYHGGHHYSVTEDYNYQE